MCDKKNYVLFTDSECLVLSPNFKLPDESQILLKIPRQNNMYSFDMKNIVPKDGLTCLVAKATSEESMLWHRRLGHVNFKNINKLVKENLVRDLPLKRFENDQTCVACLKGKQHRASCKSKAFSPITKPLFMLHMDLFGPTFVSSLMHKKYCLVVTDDYSRFSWVFFLRTKDETSEILKNFIKEIENLVDKKVKIIRSDNGTEFKNHVMDEFCREKGTQGVSESNISSQQDQDCIFMPIWKDTLYFEDASLRSVDDAQLKITMGSSQKDSHERMIRKSFAVILSIGLRRGNGLRGSQGRGACYDEVFAPVARIEAMYGLFLAYCLYDGFPLSTKMDVKSAFLLVKLKRRICMMYLQSLKILDILIKFTKLGQIDQTFHRKKSTRAYFACQIYVDGLIFGSTRKELCEEFETLMTVTMLGDTLDRKSTTGGCQFSGNSVDFLAYKKHNYKKVFDAVDFNTGLKYGMLNPKAQISCLFCIVCYMFSTVSYNEALSLTIRDWQYFLRINNEGVKLVTYITGIVVRGGNYVGCAVQPGYGNDFPNPLIFDSITKNYMVLNAPWYFTTEELTRSRARAYWLKTFSNPFIVGSLRRHLKLDDQDELPLCPKKTAWEQFSSNIAAAVIFLEADLTKTKKTYSSAYTKLILRVKKLEAQLKVGKARRHSRCSKDDEGVHAKASSDNEILLLRVTPTENHSRKEVSESNTAGGTVTYSRRSAEKRSRKDKGKATIMIEEEPKKKSKKELEQERLSYAEAIRLEEQMNKEQIAQITRDEEIERQWDEEERKRAIDEAKTAKKIDWNDPSVIRYHTQKMKPKTVAQARRNMIKYLKNQGNYKINDFKGMSYNDIRPIFEKVWDFNQNIEPMDADHGSEKQKSPTKEKSPEKVMEEEIDTQEELKEGIKEPGAKRKKSIPRKSTRKRQKLEEDAEKDEGFLDIVPREEAPIEVESISTKFPIMD
ncbi:putative ribonuclease H-like domain-containing protein [Tanacetum coccineum]|uniref:Ribonuclease H-like domain-containing protein n=1 Tax=Tanacetum coccineum TaxID=301880 RepID=A0ABQ4YQB9_9ASTR